MIRKDEVEGLRVKKEGGRQEKEKKKNDVSREHYLLVTDVAGRPSNMYNHCMFIIIIKEVRLIKYSKKLG